MGRIMRLALRHRAVVTVAVIAALLLNLTVVAQAQPPDPAKGSLPLAARCAGGGPGCAEQPLIPPPAGGLPHFDPPPPPVFGALVAVEPAAAPSLTPSPPPALEHPPQLELAA